MAIIDKEIAEYIEKTPLVELATVRSDGAPVVRTLGAFAPADGGATVYFVTHPDAEKTRHIQGNHRVSLFFQHEGQALPEFRNVALIGTAARIADGQERARAVELTSARSAYVKERVSKEGDGVFEFYKVTATEVKYLDYRKGIGPGAVRNIVLQGN
jgi:nitroimidazol reductase NimA-like FMN-containing flavoprotein (pyridoxamine 5'-phosphate oxidase superfamily)